MPAAAVIPAPMAYIKVVAVKKLVVGFLAGATGRPIVVCTSVASGHICGERVWHSFVVLGTRIVYCEKIRVFKAGLCLGYVSME